MMFCFHCASVPVMRVMSEEHVLQVLFPVSLPDEGGFDWLDQFLETHPHRPEKRTEIQRKTDMFLRFF